MLVKWYKAYCLFVVISIITSCSLVAPMATSSTTAKQLSFVKTSVEVVSQYYTDKTATDHVVSIVLRKDCKISRVAKREEICNEIKPKAYDDKFSSKLSNILNENKMNMVLNLKETDLVNFNQNFADDRKKVDDIKKNNIISVYFLRSFTSFKPFLFTEATSFKLNVSKHVSRINSSLIFFTFWRFVTMT